MKKMWICLCFWGSVFCEQPPFPDALLYKGDPIHPICVVATQFGDSSRFELKPIVYDYKSSETSEEKILEYQLTYNFEENRVESWAKYSQD